MPPSRLTSKLAARALEDDKDPFWKKLALRLREARKTACMSQAEVCNQAGIYPHELSALENGRNQRPSLPRLRRLAVCYKVTVAELVAVDKEPEDWDQIPTANGDKSWYWRVTSKPEMRLIAAYRLLMGREKRLLQLMVKLMPRARSPITTKKMVRVPESPALPADEKATV